MPRYKDADTDGFHFLTFSCQKKLELFCDDHIYNVFVQNLRYVSTNKTFYLLAYVVMPTHVHIVVELKGISVSKILRMVKQPFSFQIREYIRGTYVGIYDQCQVKRGTRSSFRFWMAGGGYDKRIRNLPQVREQIKYIHRNPVRAGLVDCPEQWKWSSYRFYLNGDPDPIAVHRPDWI